MVTLNKSLTIMGGTNTGAGNVTTTAEFNFWYDPEAVFVVLDRIPPTVRKLFLLSGGAPLFEKLNPGAPGKFDLRGRQTVAKTQHHQK